MAQQNFNVQSRVYQQKNPLSKVKKKYIHNKLSSLTFDTKIFLLSRVKGHMMMHFSYTNFYGGLEIVPMLVMGIWGNSGDDETRLYS